MQFPLHHPTFAAIIPGALSAGQVRSNAASIDVPIPDELWHDLKREGLLREDAPTP
jgi:D-threo-aldose 1-dehydrogenase